MGSILDMHHEYLGDILEGDDAQGGDTVAVPIEFTNDLITHKLTGWVNIVTSCVPVQETADITTLKSSVTVNWQTIACMAGAPNSPGWEDNMPKDGWTVNTCNPITGIPASFVIEENGTRNPDWHLGTITYFLTEYDEVFE